MKLKDHAFAIKEKKDHETDEKNNTCNVPESNECNSKGSTSSPKF